MSPQIVEQLSPQPFRQWCAWRLDPQGWDRPDSAPVEEAAVRQLAYDLGIGERKLHRWRVENQSLEKAEVADALHHADCALWEVYPDADEATAERTHGYCTGCREDVPVGPQLDCLFCGKRTWRKRSGVDMSAYSKLTDEQLRKLHKLNQQGVTIRELGRRIWRATGYSSFMSAEGGIRRGFRRLGLQTTSTYGYEAPLRRCRKIATSTGRPCGKWPMVGSDYCMQHDEERREEVVAQAVAAARASKELRSAA